MYIILKAFGIWLRALVGIGITIICDVCEIWYHFEVAAAEGGKCKGSGFFDLTHKIQQIMWLKNGMAPSPSKNCKKQ